MSEKSSPLVSIIIPCFNVEDHIAVAVRCAREQAYPNKEIICIDNDSNDETWEKLNELKDRFPELIISQEFRTGAPAARNRGLAMSKGEWIQFLDADDFIGKEKITHQISLVRNRDDVSFIAAATLKGDPQTDTWLEWFPHERIWTGLLTNSLGNTCANLFRRAVLDKVNGWDESLKSSQEYDLMFRIMQRNDQVLLDPVAKHTRITSARPGAISTSDVEGNKHRFLALNARICSYLKNEKPKVYASLDSDYFEQMYQRIRLNSIKGFDGSYLFYRAILPSGFKPHKRPYDPWWFKAVESLFGFRSADKLQRLRNKLSPSFDKH